MLQYSWHQLTLWLQAPAIVLSPFSSGSYAGLCMPLNSLSGRKSTSWASQDASSTPAG